MDVTHHTSLSFLTKGSRVEVSSDEEGFSGAWYVATVIHPPPSISDHTRNNLVYVEYYNLFADDGSSTKLREYANVAYVRPPPPLDSDNINTYSDFELNDVVDAFYRDAWRTGVITSVVDKHNFVVTFQNRPDKLQFHISKLRIHRKWVDGKWVQPNQRTAGLMFTVGKKVEVSFEKEGLRDVWYPATILKNSGNDTFLVEYQQPGIGDESVLHKVTVDYLHIRPSPPHLRDKNFVLLEKVDAYYDFGWRSGVITKELADNRYNVFFKHMKQEREFIYSRVRPHMEWKSGNWFNTSQGDTYGITTRSSIDKQIEQMPASIDKQSTVSTSTTKRTKLPNLDSNDKTSTPSKILNDQTLIDDPSKRQDDSSVGQSDGFDSEAIAINDQAFSKTENLSHGKKVCSKRGNGIELGTPIVNSSRKKGRLANELKSLLNYGEVSREKIPQKLPDEILDVAEGNIIQPGVPSVPLTAVDKAENEGDVASVVPKRKRGRPPKLQALNLETAVTVNSQKGGLVTSSGSKLSEDDRILPLTNEKREQNLSVGRGRKKKSSRKGKRGKRRTISINTESPALESRDALKEKVDGRSENDSEQENLEAALEKSPDTVFDDQPLSKWFEGVQSHGPVGSMEQSSKASEKRKEIVAYSNGETLPFARSTKLWQTLESMEAFQKIPQRPHFRPLLEGVKESAREGVAIGIMVMYSTVVDKTHSLKIDDPRSEIDECLETLAELEDNGFDMNLIREKLTEWLEQKDRQDELEKQLKRNSEKMEENHKVQGEKVEEVEELDREIRELEERRKHVILKKDKTNSEIDVMKSTVEKIKREIREARAEFDRIAATPF